MSVSDVDIGATDDDNDNSIAGIGTTDNDDNNFGNYNNDSLFSFTMDSNFFIAFSALCNFL